MKNGLTQRECELEVAIQVPAGSETSTTAIRSIMLYILSSARVHGKLKEEIAQGIREGRISSPITQNEAKELPYLQVRTIPIYQTRTCQHLQLKTNHTTATLGCHIRGHPYGAACDHRLP